MPGNVYLDETYLLSHILNMIRNYTNPVCVHVEACIMHRPNHRVRSNQWHFGENITKEQAAHDWKTHARMHLLISQRLMTARIQQINLLADDPDQAKSHLRGSKIIPWARGGGLWSGGRAIPRDPRRNPVHQMPKVGGGPFWCVRGKAIGARDCSNLLAPR